MSAFQSNGVSLAYEDRGPRGGKPIVFVHGFPFSRKMWTAQAELLEKDFRVVLYDVRGHGESEAGDGPFFLEHLVDDLVGLLDHLKIEKAVLCGLSMGGYIALRAVERNPERVAALVLADTKSEADGNEAKVKRAQGLAALQKNGPAAYAENFVKNVFAKANVASPAAAAIKSVIAANPPAGIGGTLLALAARTDTTASLAKIAVPTLVLVGEEDAVTPPAAAEALARGIPGAKLHKIPGAAHMSNLENSAAFNQHLLAFLRSL